jgi:hypothetical protein
MPLCICWILELSKDCRNSTLIRGTVLSTTLLMYTVVLLADAFSKYCPVSWYNLAAEAVVVGLVGVSTTSKLGGRR